jgi:lipopolysaccharide biosynthesis regulator YciM
MNDPVTIGLLIAVALIVVVVVALLFSSTPIPRRPRKGAAEAFHRLLLGQRAQARRLLTEIVRRSDAAPEVYLRLGDLLREDGEVSRALALHQGLLARPSLDEDLRRLAELSVADDLMALGRLEEAERRLATLDEHLVDEALLARHALALHRLGRAEDAAETLVRRAQLEGGEARNHAARYLVEMGRESLRRGKPEVARGRARRARHLDPTLAACYVVEGDALLHAGRPDGAIEIWREGLAQASGSRAALLPRLVEAAFHGGQLEALLGELERLRENHPADRDLWKAVVDLRLRRGDLESFFALVESPPYPGAADLSAWAGWLRHLSAQAEARPLKRLLASMPDSFGPQSWRCATCGAEDPEPRVACPVCGRWSDLVPVPPGTARALPARASHVPEVVEEGA